MRFLRMSLTCLFALFAVFAVQAEPAGGGSPFADVGGVALTRAESEAIDGSLHVRGTRIGNRSRRVSHSYRSSNKRRPHCDIIARNTASRRGSETSYRSGRVDFNRRTVSQIYRRTGRGGSRRPRRGSSGYIFTFNRQGAGHMQYYSRHYSNRRGYKRYTNRSYPGTSRTVRVGRNYRPPKVTKQVFVALPRRAYYRSWYR